MFCQHCENRICENVQLIDEILSQNIRILDVKNLWEFDKCF